MSLSVKGPFKDAVSALINEHLPDPGLSSISVRITDVSGRTLLSSANTADLPDISGESLREANHGSAYYETLTLHQREEKASFYRSYSTPVQQDGKTFYVLQVFRPLYQNQFAMKTMLKNILIFIPVTALLTGLLGMTMAGLALKPVHDIIKTTRQINAENLHLRIDPPKTRDEIRELADFFNEMLSRLEESFLAQKRFIQDASHELKTPITILKGEMEVALKKARSVGEYEEILKSNLEEIERISLLVENLLTLARLDNRENSQQNSILDLNELVKQASENMTKPAEAKNIKLNLNLANEKLLIKADKDQLIRAFSNIIENAIKYSPPSSSVEIGSHIEDGKFVISVTDEGPGIPPESLPHIFERFYRADTSRSTEGFGLGLSIAKSALENCSASIKAENISGSGARFIIIFNSTLTLR
ncbi:MAG: ATP-binding protein [Elusimicrobiota bacterium]